ncbi:hypothetical protein COU61_02315, partial [Candidatus Pacearchaeota archaeon CG10_big_fil_rev_8_21_14_0_10_35_13]
MGLIDYLRDGVARTRASFSSNREKWQGYLTDHELTDYFGKGFSKKKDAELTEEERTRKGGLERITNSIIEKYDRELHGVLRKAATRGTMGLAVGNDLYSYIKDLPVANVTGIGYALFATKTLMEVPAMVRYLSKSHDWYGALKHYLMKPVNYLLPVIGGALEAGSFERMVRKRVMQEIKHEFIKQYGNYIPVEEKLKVAGSTKLKSAIYQGPGSEEKKKAA